MFIASFSQTMRNAKPKLATEDRPVVKTIDQMRAEKRLADDRRRREISAQWFTEMRERSRVREKALEQQKATAEYAIKTVREVDPPKGIIARIALANGYSYDEIVSSERREKKIVKVRHEAIYAIRDAYPAYSQSRIARLFDMDPTSVIYALRKRDK